MNSLLVCKQTLLRLSLIVVSTLICVSAANAEKDAVLEYRPEEVIHYQSRIPLGWESFRLSSSGICFYLLGSVESAKFIGWQKITHANRARLLSANGEPVQAYPEYLQFRITASAREKMLDNQPFPVDDDVSVNDYLLHLRFRLTVFHGLQQRTLRPASVESIGMPSDISYDERIYHLAFDLGHVPIDDRVVLEIIAPSGERLSKFHVDLF